MIKTKSHRQTKEGGDLYSVHFITVLHYIHLKILQPHEVNYCAPVMAKGLWIMFPLFF